MISSLNFTTVYPELGIQQIVNKYLWTQWEGILWLMLELKMENERYFYLYEFPLLRQ